MRNVAEDMRELESRIKQHLKINKAKYIFQGLIFVIAGVLALIVPFAAALSVELIFGSILLVTGVFQLIFTIKSGGYPWAVLSALLSIGIGTLILWKPFPILIAFVVLLAIFMTVESIFEFCLAFQFRSLPNWGWMLFSAITTLVLAVIIWVGLPVFGIVYFGWMIAVNLLLYGLSLLMLVRGVKSENS